MKQFWSQVCNVTRGSLSTRDRNSIVSFFVSGLGQPLIFLFMCLFFCFFSLFLITSLLSFTRVFLFLFRRYIIFFLCKRVFLLLLKMFSWRFATHISKYAQISPYIVLKTIALKIFQRREERCCLNILSYIVF